MTRPVVWLLSAYRSDSHAYWADRLCETHTDYHWIRCELPGRHFRWRIRGNPLSWIDALPDEIPDLIIATSMVDLATLKGLHPQIAHTPCIYYFHENQFAYPSGEHQVRSIEPQMVQLYGALAADTCLFNSDYNMLSFLEGIDTLLDLMPDHVPHGISQRIRDKSSVLPVPVDPIAGDAEKQPLILWNHRWEYDKAPDIFADAVIELARQGCEFELALLGARAQQTPAALTRIRQAVPQHIRYDMKADASEYHHIVATSKIVTSTAIHEFQGISVLEAVSAGAIPVVPDALCYPEQYDQRYRYTPADIASLTSLLRFWIACKKQEIPNVDSWLAPQLHCRWQRYLSAILTDR